MDGSTTVDITPDKTLIQKLGQVGYRTEQAVAELVDNSIDARIPGACEAIRVVLDFEARRIGVDDDGSGMDREELAAAMTVAKGTKSGDKLGRFGIGMKSACSALGRRFEIVTSKVGSNTEYAAEYDENLWLDDPAMTWSNFEIRERELAEEDWHGTRITIYNPKVPMYGNLVTKFKKSFGIRYEPYLADGQVSIQVNTVTCSPERPDMEAGSERDLAIELKHSSGTMTGRIALLKKRSVKGNYGIHLFKNGRLIRPFEKFGFSAHPAHAKIIGRLDMDHVPVNFNKSAFIRDSMQYTDAEEAFGTSPEVRDAIRRSRAPKETTVSADSLFGYFAGGKPDVLPTRMKDKTAARLLDEADDMSVDVGGRKVPVRIESAPGRPLYGINPDGSVVINRASRAFEFVPNPLFLLGFIAIELRSAQDPGMAKMIMERNARLEKFIADWSAEPPGRWLDRGMQAAPPERRNYGLQNDLVDVHNFLDHEYEYRFQFTALCTLAGFLHYMKRSHIYTVHTSPGRAEYLIDMVTEKFGDKFILMDNPDEKAIRAMTDAWPSTNLILVREYGEIPGPTIAPPEKAWVDLFNEVHTHKIPLDEYEVRLVFESTQRFDLMDMDKMMRYAKHLKKLQKIKDLLTSGADDPYNCWPVPVF